METLTLPFENIIVFVYSLYGITAISLLSVNSINIAISRFKKGVEDA